MLTSIKEDLKAQQDSFQSRLQARRRGKGKMLLATQIFTSEKPDLTTFIEAKP
jgi:hypothetical protein